MAQSAEHPVLTEEKISVLPEVYAESKIKVVLFDVDDCLLYRGAKPRGWHLVWYAVRNWLRDLLYFIRHGKKPLWATEKHEPLLNQICEEVRTGPYTKLILMVGSNRQDSWIDLRNHRGLPQIFEAIKKYCTSKCEGKEVILDPLLLVDSWEKPSTYEKIQEHSDAEKFLPRIWSVLWAPKAKILRKSKTNIGINTIHYIANKYPHMPIDAEVYDNKPEMWQGLTKNSELLPEKTTLIIYNYTVEKREREFFAFARGYGKVREEQDIKQLNQCIYQAEKKHKGPIEAEWNSEKSLPPENFYRWSVFSNHCKILLNKLELILSIKTDFKK